MSRTSLEVLKQLQEDKEDALQGMSPLERQKMEYLGVGFKKKTKAKMFRQLLAQNPEMRTILKYTAPRKMTEEI